MYKIFALDLLPNGIANGATGINNHGRVSGWADAADQSRHAALWTLAGGLTDLGTSHPLGATAGRREAYGINDRGQAVGYSVTVDDRAEAFRWTPPSPNATFGIYEPLTGVFAMAMAINNSGHAVGLAHNGTGDAFLWSAPATRHALGTHGSAADRGFTTCATAINDHGTAALIDRPGPESTPAIWVPDVANGTSGTLSALPVLPGSLCGLPTGINREGAVVGWCSKFAEHGSRAFLWTPDTPQAAAGSIEDLGVLAGADASVASGINSSNVVVGSSGGRAFVRRSGVMEDLNSLIAPGSGWTLLEATGINDRGWIVGNGHLNGQRRGFLCYPPIRIPPRLHLPSLPLPQYIAILFGGRDDRQGVGIPLGSGVPVPIPPGPLPDQAFVSPGVEEVLRQLAVAELARGLLSGNGDELRRQALKMALEQLRRLMREEHLG